MYNKAVIVAKVCLIVSENFSVGDFDMFISWILWLSLSHSSHASHGWL